MAKVEIIDSYSLGCLISNLHAEIEEADSQIIVFGNELKRENQHRQDGKTTDRIRNRSADWILRRDVLHQCLCKIQNHTKEVEI